MYAMHGKLTAQPRKRDILINILTLAATRVGMLPGCRLYLVHEDLEDENAVWVYEVWEDKEAHDASLQNENVRALISEALPLMAGKPDGIDLRLVGGHGVNNLLWG